MTSINSASVKKFLFDNSPTILTGLAIGGALSTAIFAGQASYKAGVLLADSDETHTSFKHKLQIVWPLYLPAVGMGLFTVTCQIMSNNISTRRAAAMASAYSVLDRGFETYRDKVVEQYGAKKEQKIRDDVAQDQVRRAPTNEVVIGKGDIMCHDAWSGRYFKSDMESLKKAQNDLNYRILNDNYASLTDFYSLIGLAGTANSDEVGWSNERLLELQFSTVLSDDQKPCISFNFIAKPIRDYYRFS